MRIETVFYLICAAVILIMLLYYIKRKRRLSSALFGMISGFAALVLMNKFGYFIGGELPLNTFNVCGSMVLGIPFVAAMIIIKYL